MKKVKLSPVEREILWTLEEAGAENLSTLAATVKGIIKEVSNETFSQSLDNLERKKFVYFEKSDINGNSVVLTEKGRIYLSI